MPYQDDPHTAGVKRRFEESSSTSQPSEERHKRRKNDLNKSCSDSISEISSTSSNAQGKLTMIVARAVKVIH